MANDLVAELSEGAREVSYLFNPDLAERCPHFPPQTSSNTRAMRHCNLVDKGCHFSEQVKYEQCLIYQAYKKGMQIPSHS